MDGNDDERVAAAFRAAVTDVPEARFGHEDVLAGSRRIARRNRVLLASGAAAAVIVLAGGVTAGVVLARDGGTVTAASAPESADSAGRAAAPNVAGPGGAGAGSAGSPVVPPATPLGPAAEQGCVNPQDPALRALVNAAMPELAGATEAPTTMICRLGAGREVHLEVTDGALSGLLTVSFSPAGEPPAQTSAPVGWVTATVSTASGGTVTVTAAGNADSGGVPFADRVPGLVAALAAHL